VAVQLQLADRSRAPATQRNRTAARVKTAPAVVSRVSTMHSLTGCLISEASVGVPYYEI
jgi:hypothetical protein